MKHTQLLLSAAQGAVDGKISGILLRPKGDVLLLNAGKDLVYTGFNPESELLKGLIVELKGKKVTRLLAACFPKFYNIGENTHNDAKAMEIMAAGGKAYFTEKHDGTNIRAYYNPQTKRVEFATRGMLEGVNPPVKGYIDFLAEARKLAQKKYPVVLNPEFARRYTPVFELIHPDNRIVTNYGSKHDLILLGVYDLENDARPLNRAELEKFSVHYKFNLTSLYSVANAQNWESTIKQLRAKWQNTDLEGSVVTFELRGEVVFRIKVKSLRYMEIMRAFYYCSLKRTAEIAHESEAETWDKFLKVLRKQFGDLPEEVLFGAAGYQANFSQYKKWRDSLKTRAANIVKEFDSLPAFTMAQQKEFAIHIKDNPNRSLFFELRKINPKDPVKFVFNALYEREKKNLSALTAAEVLA